MSQMTPVGSEKHQTSSCKTILLPRDPVHLPRDSRHPISFWILHSRRFLLKFLVMMDPLKIALLLNFFTAFLMLFPYGLMTLMHCLFLLPRSIFSRLSRDLFGGIKLTMEEYLALPP